MLVEALAAGLLVDPAKQAEVLGKTSSPRFVPPDPNAVVHESLTGAWNLAEFVFKKHYNWNTGKDVRRMNLYKGRTLPPRALVHESAFQRGGGYRDRLPADAVPVSTYEKGTRDPSQ